MIDVIPDPEVTTIILSTEEAHQLARELHVLYLSDSGNSVLYRLYDALVPTEE